MKVYGQPLEVVNTWQRHGAKRKLVVLFQFDENGEHEIDEKRLDSDMLDRIKQNFKTGELKHCKKCDYTCENQGDLLAHYRTKHKRGD